MSAPVNPFVAMSSHVDKNQSIAFAAVFGIISILYGIRLMLGTGHGYCYINLTLLSVVRIATFITRVLVADAKPEDSNYKTLLIVSGVLVVFGFLFMAEVVMRMVQDWYFIVCNAREGTITALLDKFRKLGLVAISVIGIMGTINEVTAASDNDAAKFSNAKDLRLASGGLFLAVSILTFLCTLAIACCASNRASRPWSGGFPFLLCSIGMIVESVYRTWSASSMTGWVAKQVAMDILLIAPELVVLLCFLVLNFKDLGNVTFVCCGQRQRSTMPPPPMQYPQAGPYQAGPYPQPPYLNYQGRDRQSSLGAEEYKLGK